MEAGLGDLARGDFPSGKEDQRFESSPGSVRRQRGGGVARRGTGQPGDADLLGDTDAHSHPAVLERTRRVHPLVFHAEARDADVVLQTGDLVQWRAALGE